MPKGPPSPKPSSGSRRGSTDLVRLYLQDIGRVDLLSHEEELTLARQVQRRERLLRERKRLAATAAELADLIALEDDRQRLASQLGHWPAVQQWAEHLSCTVPELRERLRQHHEAWAERSGLSVAELKQALHHGRRARDRMIQANLRLVVSVAKKYQNQGLELLDLVQEGAIGLERAVDKFDPAMGYKFSTYAYWWIRQGITRAIATQSRTIRLPIHITETLNKLKKGQRELSQELGRTPTVTELAEFVELPEEEVKDLLCRARQPVSLETKVGDGDDTELLDLLAADGTQPEELVDGECLRSDMRDLLEQLPDLQCRVLKMRYGIPCADVPEPDEPMSLTGIGRILGMSRDRVRNLERDGLAGLRRLSENVQAYVAV